MAQKVNRRRGISLVTRPLPPLMAIVDADTSRRFGWTMVDLATAYLSGGARLLQIRAKGWPSGPLLDAASGIVALAHRTDAIVIVNDRADIARLCDADGVHVGQDDLAPAAVRRVVGPDAIVGLSTHTLHQIEAGIQEPVTYIAIGPVFGTETKATGYGRLGLDGVRDAAAHARTYSLPLVAIGGITLDAAPDVVAAGASCVAVVSDLVSSGDPARRVRTYLERLTV